MAQILDLLARKRAICDNALPRSPDGKADDDVSDEPGDGYFPLGSADAAAFWRGYSGHSDPDFWAGFEAERRRLEHEGIGVDDASDHADDGLFRFPDLLLCLSRLEDYGVQEPANENSRRGGFKARTEAVWSRGYEPSPEALATHRAASEWLGDGVPEPHEFDIIIALERGWKKTDWRLAFGHTLRIVDA